MTNKEYFLKEKLIKQKAKFEEERKLQKVSQIIVVAKSSLHLCTPVCLSIASHLYCTVMFVSQHMLDKYFCNQEEQSKQFQNTAASKAWLEKKTIKLKESKREKIEKERKEKQKKDEEMSGKMISSQKAFEAWYEKVCLNFHWLFQ